MKKVTWSGLLLIIFLCLIAAWYVFFRQTPPANTTHEQSTPVTAVAAKLSDVPVFIDALGTVTATRTVTIVPQIDGILDQVYFKEGQPVKQGQLIAHIDSRQLEAQRLAAQGTLVHDQALLLNDQQNLRRYQQSIKSGAITQQMLDTQVATVKEDEGTVQTDSGTVKNLDVELSYTAITSPVEGVIGLRLVDPGNYITTTSTTGIAVITQLDPATVLYAVPEDYRDQISAAITHGTVPVFAYNRDDQRLLSQGQLIAVDNQVDTSTGTIKVKAEFPNSGNVLFPNQFVNVHMQVNTLKHVPVIPTAAIQHGSKGDFIFVVGGANKVELRNVKVGPTSGQNSAILNNGVQPGERIVTDGADKLDNGSLIRIVSP